MIDNSLHIPIMHQNFFSDDDNTNYLKVLNKEVDRLVELNDDCWGRFDSPNDTWSSYSINKDILFNNDIFDTISNDIKDAILQYTMGVRADTQRHQVHLMDSMVKLSKSNPKKDFVSDDSQHFVGYVFLASEGHAGNLIIRNPLAPKKRFHHNGDSPFREYFIKQVTSGDLVILPSHIEHKMSDFSNDSEFRFVEFGVTVA